MKTIGVVGGVASGKSLASQMLVELGAPVLDADRAGHKVLAEDPEVREALRQRWGDAILTASGVVDRAAIAQRVFADNKAGSHERKFLEALLHPRIRDRLNQLRDEFAAAGKVAVVLDAPLLLEAGWAPLCDYILFIEAPVETRRDRAKGRGWSDAEFSQREAAQWTTAEKRRHATHVLSNSCSSAELREAVGNFWAENIGPISVKR
jgi:dephospho-CoA kinase